VFGHFHLKIINKNYKLWQNSWIFLDTMVPKWYKSTSSTN
jgi:hypothetical protein